MATEWGAAIQCDGKRPAWLRDDEYIRSVWSTGSGPVKHIYWDVIERQGQGYQLPADHWYYTVQAYNEKHGTSFYPWGGGNEAPDDWDGGAVLLRKSKEYDEPVRWSHYMMGNGDYHGSDIIGYTRRIETVTTDTVQIARMTEAEALDRFGGKLPYASITAVRILRELGLIREPTEAERIAATTGLTVEQVQAVLDAR